MKTADVAKLILNTPALNGTAISLGAYILDTATCADTWGEIDAIRADVQSWWKAQGGTITDEVAA